jgi:hydroxymethylpyrimidine pyrophosphatase-like HAD family hydrolase
MHDRYTNSSEVIERLMKEYHKHGSLVIGCDFDNTLFDFYNTGDTYPKVRQLLKDCFDLGFTICIYTGNTDQQCIETVMNEIGIESWYKNSSPIKSVSKPWKPYFNILLDDRAGLASACTDLQTVVSTITINMNTKYEKAKELVERYKYEYKIWKR